MQVNPDRLLPPLILIPALQLHLLDGEYWQHVARVFVDEGATVMVLQTFARQGLRLRLWVGVDIDVGNIVTRLVENLFVTAQVNIFPFLIAKQILLLLLLYAVIGVVAVDVSRG